MAFARSFQHCNLLEGAFIFSGLRGIEVNAKREGGKPIMMTNSRKAVGNTVGQVSFDGTLKLLFDDAILYQKAQADLFGAEHTFTISIDSGSLRDKIAVSGLVFTSIGYKFEGTDEIEVDLPFTALDVLVNDVSLAPEFA